MTEAPVLPLTNRTRIALGIARGIAAALGDDDLTSAHVALGLLREGENPAVAVLWRARVALPALRAELERPLEQEAERRDPDHEWLFWDSHEFMRQLGLIQ